jgi:hypothetical protein
VVVESSKQPIGYLFSRKFQFTFLVVLEKICRDEKIHISSADDTRALLIKSKEIMEILRSAIEEKKKKVRRPEIPNQAYVDRIYDEIETLQSVVAEIYDTERRRESIKQQQENEENDKKNIGVK